MGRHKRKKYPRSELEVPDDSDMMCQADGCERIVALADMISCQGPGCGNKVSLTLSH